MVENRKIFIVSWDGMRPTGGVEKVTQYMVEAWKEQYNVSVLDKQQVRKNKRYGWLMDRHCVLDCLIMSLYIKKRVGTLSVPPIVITQGFNAPFVHADICFSHGTMRGLQIAVTGSRKWHFNQYFEKIAQKKAKRICAVSEGAKKDCINLYRTSGNKIMVLENCVNSDIFKVSAELPTGPVKVLFSGRLEHGKGIDRIMSLARKIECKEDIQLLIATPTSMNVDLFQGLKHTKIYQGLSFEEMKNFYVQGDVLFFPSLYEGFGMVTLECLSSGVPVIGHAVGAVGTLYDKKVEGVYLLGEEEEDISRIRAIAFSYRDLSRRKQLHQYIEEHYSEAQYRKKLENLIRELPV